MTPVEALINRSRQQGPSTVAYIRAGESLKFGHFYDPPSREHHLFYRNYGPDGGTYKVKAVVDVGTYAPKGWQKVDVRACEFAKAPVEQVLESRGVASPPNGQTQATTLHVQGPSPFTANGKIDFASSTCYLPP